MELTKPISGTGKSTVKQRIRQKRIAIKNASYRVHIWNCSNSAFWRAYVSYNLAKNLGCKLEWTTHNGYCVFASNYQEPGKGFKTENESKKDWEKFAKRNNITNWVFVSA